MNTSFFITCNRGKLRAYRKTPAGALERVADVSIHEGLSRISEIVTDQAGAFPVSGSTGTSAGENLPLQEELETRSLRTLAREIDEILAANKPVWWALAAPPEIHRSLLEMLADTSRETLSVHCRLDLTGVPPDRLLGHFRKAAEAAATNP